MVTLKHTKFDNIKISLPSGGTLYFKDKICSIPEESLDTVFNRKEIEDLVSLGKVELVKGALLKKETIREEKIEKVAEKKSSIFSPKKGKDSNKK